MATPKMAASNEILADAHVDELKTAAYKGDWKTTIRIISHDPIIRGNDDQLKSCLAAILDIAVCRGHRQLFMKTLKLVRDPQLLTGTLAYKYNILHCVAADGDIKQAKALVDKCPSLTQSTSTDGETPLHIAAKFANNKDLIWYLTLATRDADPGLPISGPEAKSLIVFLMVAGYYDIIHFLLQTHHRLAEIIKIAQSTDDNDRPLLRYLVSKPSEFPSGTKLGWLGCCIYPFIPVEVDHFEPPTHIQQLVPGFSASSSYHHPRMQILMQSITSAFQPHKFRSRVWGLMEKLVPGILMIRDTKLKHKWVIKLIKIAFEQPNWNLDDWSSRFSNIMLILEEAASSGTIEILQIFFNNYYVQLKTKDEDSLLIATIKHRQEKVFNFLFRNSMGFRGIISMPGKQPVKIKEVASYKGYTNRLHMTAKLTDCPKITSIAGAAFQMQRELQWFKGMEILVHPLDKEARNEKKGTAWEFFKKEHRHMRKEGEEWMKGTSNSCVLVATLIATVVFAAAFTVPGGNNQDNGTPIFLQRKIFMVFAAFDALAFFLSINSLWMFLSILTARFAFEDFLKKLPRKLILGFTTLFLAIISTIVAFSAALLLVLGHRQGEVIVVVVLMAFVSIVTFALLQLPLFVVVLRSTYGPNLLSSR